MKLQYRIPLAMYSVWCIIAILLCKDGLYQMNIWTLVEILAMIALPLLIRPFFILLRIIFRKDSFKPKDMSDNHTVCVWICPYISRHLLSLNPLQARCRRYSRGER